MLFQRIVVVLLLLPIGLGAIYLGGPVFVVCVGLMLGLASWEYAQLFRAGGFQPAPFLIVGGTLALTLGRYLYLSQQETLWGNDGFILSVIVMLTMFYHSMAFEKGGNQSGVDFAITLTGILYVGLLGSMLVLLRNLPNGAGWILLTLLPIWLADSGAYFVGRKFGRHPFSHRLSPNKTWEGYWGGVFVGMLGAGLTVLMWQTLSTNAPITILQGALFGTVLAMITPLGDLGESMLKRQVGVKDSGNLLPGHGGVLDRIDSWLWAAALSYYIILWFNFV